MKERTVMIMAAMVLGWAILAAAAEYRSLPEQTKAGLSATHMIKVSYKDLTETNANTAQTVTIGTIPAKHALAGVIAVLKNPFGAGTTNISSVSVTCGDVSDTALLLSGMETSTNGTIEYLKWGTGTNRVYGSETNLVVTVTPTGIDGLSTLTAGEVWIYIKDIAQSVFGR